MISRIISFAILFWLSTVVSATPLTNSPPRIRYSSIYDLSPISYSVTQLGSTETPYDNLYWDNHEDGIYVDIIDGTPLFSSRDKYDSGTGWPTFSRWLNNNNIFTQDDMSSGDLRIEVKSKRSHSHLGHLFDDGPVEYNNVRYCINSAALRFVPLANMKKEGYFAYVRLFRR